MTEIPKPCHPDEHDWAEAALQGRDSITGIHMVYGLHRICFECGAHEVRKKDGTWIPLGNPRPKQPVVWM